MEGKIENNSTVWIIILGVILVLLIVGFGMNGFGIMGFGMGFGFLSMFLFLGVLAWLIVSLSNVSQQPKHETDGLDPLSTLNRRYANGEISKKQYQEIKKELK